METRASVFAAQASLGGWGGQRTSFLKTEWVLPYGPEGDGKRGFSGAKMIEDQERCLKCGRQEGLQGVAVTIGRKTFHLFYLCAKCGNVNVEELVQIIHASKEKKIDRRDDR